MQAVSYAPPVVVRVSGGRVAPDALYGESKANVRLLTLTGANLGYSNPTLQARTGATAAEASFHWSDSSLALRVASGAGLALGVAVTVGTDCGYGNHNPRLNLHPPTGGWDLGCGHGVFTSNLCGPRHELCPGPLTIPRGGHAEGLTHRSQYYSKGQAFSYLPPAVTGALPPAFYPLHAPNGSVGEGDAANSTRVRCAGSQARNATANASNASSAREVDAGAGCWEECAHVSGDAAAAAGEACAGDRRLVCSAQVALRPYALLPAPYTLNPQPSTLNPQPSALSPHSATLNP